MHITHFPSIIGTLLLMFSFGCNAQKKLPEEMPKQTAIRYTVEVGMTGYLKKISVTHDTLFYFEEKQISGIKPVSWFAKITQEEKEQLYQQFIQNRFAYIKNTQSKFITYDAGIENVAINLSDTITCNVRYGANFPLSEADRRRYENIVNAIVQLAKKYDSARQQKEKPRFAIITYDSTRHYWIFPKGTRAASISESEVQIVKNIVAKAVKERNAKYTSASEIVIEKYMFQYIPIIGKNGEKQVWVNAFCNNHDMDISKEIVSVEDGGKCYWNMTVNPMKKTFDHFMVNGAG